MPPPWDEHIDAAGRAKYREWMQRWIDTALNRKTHLVQDAAADLRGILCLSESRDSLLMWAHYASNHRGFVIALDRKHRWLAKARQVVYSTDRPIARVWLDGREGKALSEEYLYQKSAEWSYEQEWRMVRRLASPGHSILSITRKEAKELNSLFKVPYDAIVGVVVGARMREKDKMRLAKLISANPRLRLRIFQATLSPHLFKLEFHSITRSDFLERYGGFKKPSEITLTSPS